MAWLPGLLRRNATTLGLVQCLFSISGCANRDRIDAPVVCKPEFRGKSVAVTPALKLCGEADFDSNRFAEAMAVELGRLDGIAVIPISRVLAALADRGFESVISPAHARDLGISIGADAVLVFGVTHYDPFNPPCIAITAQVYEVSANSSKQHTQLDGESRTNWLASDTSANVRVFAQTQQVMDAALDPIVADIEAFAAGRTADPGPYGWREYVVSQQHFIKYCCYSTVRALFCGPSESGVADAREEVRRP